MRTIIPTLLLAGTALLLSTMVTVAADWITYPGGKGPGAGKHIVLISGDEEYRSEEVMPMLAGILSQRHGFKCTVLFAVDPATGLINPNNQRNIPGMEALDSADLCIISLRFRALPDDQMRHFVDYLHAGKPMIALRTSTHAFSYPKDSSSQYKKYSWNSKEWPGGFGRQVLGETWISHWGHHKFEATRGVIEPGAGSHPILKGVTDIFGDTDVYEAHPPDDVQVLVRGQVLAGMTPDSPPADHRKKTRQGVEQGINDPMMPVVWLREYRNEAGTTNHLLVTTMGSATDLKNEALRRLLVNGAYWLTGLKNAIDANSNVDPIAPFSPSHYGFNGYKKGLKPDDYKLK